MKQWSGLSCRCGSLVLLDINQFCVALICACSSPVSPCTCHYNDVTLSVRHGVSYHRQVGGLFNNLFSANIKGNSNQSPLYRPFEREIHLWPMDSLHKGPITRKTFPLRDPIMHLSLEWKYQIIAHCMCHHISSFLVLIWHLTAVSCCCFLIERAISNKFFITICYLVLHSFSAYWGRGKIRRRHFQLRFLEWKCVNFAEIGSRDSN